MSLESRIKRLEARTGSGLTWLDFVRRSQAGENIPGWDAFIKARTPVWAIQTDAGVFVRMEDGSLVPETEFSSLQGLKLYVGVGPDDWPENEQPNSPN